MKKRILCITAMLCAVCLTACNLQPPVLKDFSTTSPSASEKAPSSPPTGPSKPIPTELESTPPATKPETRPTEPETKPTLPPTEPTVTKPAPTEPTVTKPAPTKPTATQPKPTEPAPEPTPGEWVISDGKTYYFLDGVAHTGWLELDGARYYFREDGTMARGAVQISDTETRYFTSTGKEVILVNPWNNVPADYSVTTKSYKGWPVAKECYAPLKQMIADCAAAGHTALVVSSYRTHDYQAQLYERRIQRFMNEQGLPRAEAEIEAAKRVAPPGTSEHELGLAVDIVDADYQKLTQKQETMPAQIWLMENSWRYGFILRYPNGTTDSTGIIYEPWHYRYVGVELATELHELGVCLEDYLAALTDI